MHTHGPPPRVPRPPGFMGQCLPCPSPPQASPGPSCPCPPQAPCQPPRPSLSATFQLYPCPGSRCPSTQAMPGGPPPTPHLPPSLWFCLTSQTYPPAHLSSGISPSSHLVLPQLPRSSQLPPTAGHCPASNSPGLPWASRVTAITLSPLCPPLPLQEALAHLGLPPPQPVWPDSKASQAPALRRHPPLPDPVGRWELCAGPALHPLWPVGEGPSL